ncbi:unnamed protein product [Brassica oleracea]
MEMRARRESKKRETDRILKRREVKSSPFLKPICICQILGFLIQRKRYYGFLTFVNTIASLNHRDSWDLESSDYRPCDVLISRLGDTFIQALTTSLPFLPLFRIGLIIHQGKRSKHRLYINVFKDVFKHVVGT